MKIHKSYKPLHYVIAMVLLMPIISHATLIVVEPDNFIDGQDISNAVAGVTLSAVGSGSDFPLTSSIIRARTPHQAGSPVPTGSLVFGVDAADFDTGFYSTEHQFRADFDLLTDFVSIMVAPDNNVGVTDFAHISIFDSNNILLDFFDTGGLSETVSFSRASSEISYLIAGNATGNFGDSFMLDRLAFNVPEPTTLALLSLGLAGLGFTRSKIKT